MAASHATNGDGKSVQSFRGDGTTGTNSTDYDDSRSAEDDDDDDDDGENNNGSEDRKRKTAREDTTDSDDDKATSSNSDGNTTTGNDGSEKSDTTDDNKSPVDDDNDTSTMDDDDTQSEVSSLRGSVQDVCRPLTKGEALDVVWTVYPPPATGLPRRQSRWIRPLVDGEEAWSMLGASDLLACMLHVHALLLRICIVFRFPFFFLHSC